jgi:hypothetical protein
MLKFVNSKSAIRVLIVGGAVTLISFVALMLNVFNVYGKVAHCSGQSGGCSLSINEIIANIATITFILGLIIAALGLLLVIARYIQTSRK